MKQTGGFDLLKCLWVGIQWVHETSGNGAFWTPLLRKAAAEGGSRSTCQSEQKANQQRSCCSWSTRRCWCRFDGTSDNHDEQTRKTEQGTTAEREVSRLHLWVLLAESEDTTCHLLPRISNFFEWIKDTWFCVCWGLRNSRSDSEISTALSKMYLKKEMPCCFQLFISLPFSFQKPSLIPMVEMSTATISLTLVTILWPSAPAHLMSPTWRDWPWQR